MFCVECGAEEDLYGHLCKKCLLSKNLVDAPKQVVITLCGGCGRVLHGSTWSDMDPREEVERELANSTKTKDELTLVSWQCPEFYPEKGDNAVECEGTFHIEAKESSEHLDLNLSFSVNAKVKIQICEPCSRQRSDYFEAVLQLRKQVQGTRASTEGLEDADTLILRAIEEVGRPEQMGFLTKSGKVTGGMDYYLGSVDLARALAKILRDRMGASVSESKSLVGMKDGRDLFRWTILARLPSLKTGDVVLYKNALYLMRSVSSKNLTMKHLLSGQVRTIQSAEEPKLIATAEKVVDAVVVSQDKDTLQVLDPETMKTVTVVRPEQLEEIGETLAVVRYNEQLHIVT